MMLSVSTLVLTIPVGILADRFGKGRVVTICFLVSALGFLLILTTRTVETLSLGFLLIGVGNSSGSILGPIYSSFFDKEDMDRAFGLFGFIQISCVSIGSLLGFVPPMLVSNYGFSLQQSYWTMLAVMVVLFYLMLPPLIVATRKADGTGKLEARRFNLRSRALVIKVSVIHALGSLGYGIFFSLFPFYMHSKFGIRSDALGTLYSVSNLVNAAANAVAPRVSKRLGSLKTIAVALGLSTPFYLGIDRSGYKKLGLGVPFFRSSAALTNP